MAWRSRRTRDVFGGDVIGPTLGCQLSQGGSSRLLPWRPCLCPAWGSGENRCPSDCVCERVLTSDRARRTDCGKMPPSLSGEATSSRPSSSTFWPLVRSFLSFDFIVHVLGDRRVQQSDHALQGCSCTPPPISIFVFTFQTRPDGEAPEDAVHGHQARGTRGQETHGGSGCRRRQRQRQWRIWRRRGREFAFFCFSFFVLNGSSSSSRSGRRLRPVRQQVACHCHRATDSSRRPR